MLCTSDTSQERIFLDRVITCDEKWVSYVNRKRSPRWLDKNEAPKHCPKAPLHPRKTLLTVWWHVHRIIKYFLLPVNKTITTETYCEYIQEIHEKLKIRRPALVNGQGPILLHEKARPRTSPLTVMTLNELGFEILQHPPYSLDLSPTDFHLFKHLGHFLSGKTFTNIPDLEHSINIFIDSQKSDFFQKRHLLICGSLAEVYRCRWSLF